MHTKHSAPGVGLGLGLALAVAFPLFSALGCANDGVAGFALNGFMLADDGTSPVRLSLAPPTTDGPCPLLDPDAFTVDGEPASSAGVALGGEDDPPDFGIGVHRCNTIAVTIPRISDEQDEPHDTELVVTSGPDVARYVGANLALPRRTVALDELENVGAASELRFRHEPASDAVATGDRAPHAFLASNASDASSQEIEVRVDETDASVLVVRLPADVEPDGDYRVSLAVSFDVTALACDVFASCDVNGSYLDEHPITLSGNAGLDPDATGNP